MAVRLNFRFVGRVDLLGGIVLGFLYGFLDERGYGFDGEIVFFFHFPESLVQLLNVDDTLDGCL